MSGTRGTRTFVGFGFGPIQAGLMVAEAMDCGGFQRFVISEIDPVLVDAVRGAGNVVTINVAGADGIQAKRMAGVELLNPKEPAERERILEAACEAQEMATAIPNVSLYSAGGDISVAALLAEAGRRRTARAACVIYAAENHNFAAELLREEMLLRASAEELAGIQILNTVIGKMSGVISTPQEMRRLALAPLVPGFERCVLVERFNRILVSRVTLPGFRRAITVFQERDDLLPFEEAKLFGHNAIHALLGSVARLKGYEVMSEIRQDRRLMDLGRSAFLEESGKALVGRHGGTGDRLFTATGMAEYAEDLLERMTNPFLHDRVERVIRDPRRKLGWSDRLFGAMRLALSQGIRPTGLAVGAAATLAFALEREPGGAEPARRYLTTLWGAEATGAQREECLTLVEEAQGKLADWRR